MPLFQRGRASMPARRPADPLLRRLAVEVLVVRLRVGTGVVDDAVPMIRRRIERIELQLNIAGIDDPRRPRNASGVSRVDDDAD